MVTITCPGESDDALSGSVVFSSNGGEQKIQVSAKDHLAPKLTLISNYTGIVGIGKEFTVKIKVENAKELFGASLSLEFDKTRIVPVTASDGDALGGDILFSFNKGDGTISLSITKKPGNEGVNASGILANVTFRTLSEGEIQISFAEDTVKLNKSNGSSIDGAESLSVSSFSGISASVTADSRLIATWGNIKYTLQ